MLFEFGIIWDSPETVLVEETWQWEIGFEVNDSLIIGFGMDLNIWSHFSTQSRSEVRGLGGNCIKTFMSIGITVLLTSQPDIVRDSDDERNNKSVAAIERFDGAEAIFQIISSCGIEEDTVKFKP